MKITNKYHLPEPVVFAVTHDRYDPGDGDVSCTTLIAPAQIFQLRLVHGDEAEEDASDRIWSMIGSAVHYIVENACEDMRAKGLWTGDSISERRFYHTIANKKVSAQIDLYHDRELTDFKVTSVWAIKDARFKGKDEWIAQLNIQRYLMQKNGIEVDKLWIMAIARDWNKSGRLRDKDYPPRAVKIPIKVWTMEQTKAYIMSRINALYSEHRILCTPAEMWETQTKHAVMKKGRQRALRLLDSRDDALEWALANNHAIRLEDTQGIEMKGGHYIEIRPGERKRCADYCDMAPFCDQYKDWKKAMGIKE